MTKKAKEKKKKSEEEEPNWNQYYSYRKKNNHKLDLKDKTENHKKINKKTKERIKNQI